MDDNKPPISPLARRRQDRLRAAGGPSAARRRGAGCCRAAAAPRRLPGPASTRRLDEAKIALDWVSGVFDRRDQRGDHRRQPAGGGGWRGCARSGSASTDRKIWPFTPDGDIYRKARNAVSSWVTMGLRPARLLRAAPAGPTVQHRRRDGRDELLRYGAAAQDARGAGRLPVAQTRARRAGAFGAVNVLSGKLRLFRPTSRRRSSPRHVDGERSTAARPCR